ncbi:class I SAM-dependent methyltransferase [Microvirga aerophila]|uniref:SAM-dependent methyltransferase n=1 Tax=Microvirga aerophila TaxID=670291 RepID=A0A512BY51_9HYPH|nr:methyltransferase domain-containing protein [Microvirga aerophila]GEO16881.1 SAM-dependent methyltransferase [Microvirga aerophila]
MAERFGPASAGGYDRGFGHVSREFIPALLRAARLAPGQRVLDVATGTGIAAEASVAAVGPSGHVVATDLFPAMLEKARERLGHLPNVSFAIADGQAPTLPDESFDAVLCAMGLMLFPDPARGLAEFRRVLRGGGWAAASVNTTLERAFATRVDAVIGRHAPEHAATAARYFSLGDAGRLRSLFAAAGFCEVETFTRGPAVPFASFDAYFAPIEEGQGPTGQAFAALPAEVWHVVCEEVRCQLEGGAGGPIEVEVELLFACGRR